MSEKYILQYGSLAGWPYKVAKGLRDKGVNSKNIVLHDTDVHDLKRELPFDEALCPPNSSAWTKATNILKYINRMPEECEIVHYHSSNVLHRELHWLYEGPKLKKHGIPMLISFGGGDARPTKLANQLNPYFYKPYNRLLDTIIAMRYFSWSRNIDYAATEPEMAEYARPHFKKIFTFRQPVDLTEINCHIPDADNKEPVFLHIPTEPKVKGTEEIIAAAEQLKSEGYKFKFVMKRQLTQQEVYKEIQKCDVYLDELKCGSHGVTTVETLAAGKPTVTYIREDLWDKFPADCPIVNGNPDTIYDVMKRLITNHKERHEIGLASRAYAEKYHDLKVVCDDLIQIYDEISSNA